MPPTYGTDPRLVQGVIAGGLEALVTAQEGAEDHPEDGAAAMDEREVGEDDFVLGIASSGTTPFVHGALRRARERGARTGFLLCTYPSEELTSTHDVVISPLVGPEVITGSTRMKAGTATKMVLNTITTASMVRMGKVFGNLMVDLQVTCEKLRDRQKAVLIQELIEGDEYGVDILYDKEESFIGFTAKKKLAMRAGETDKAVTVPSEVLKEVVHTIAQNLPHRGNMDCDFIERDGQFYLLELNPRFGGGYPFTHLAGANHVKMLLDDYLNDPIDDYFYEVGKAFA
ncbi:MAG TPA: N-acetylmuramic acid 6-phosphate etherase, partial [Longimicrobiales bacterium]|nr:N-acetylmuramic acid 6-phosphate etherase [Longimicrobiales bacterium]